MSIKIQAETFYTHVSVTVLYSSFEAPAATCCSSIDVFLLLTG